MRWALGQGIRNGQPWKAMWRAGECVWHSCQKMQGDAKNTRTSGPHLHTWWYDMVYFRIKHGYLLHRKLYILTGWSAEFFFLCHNSKWIPTENRRGIKFSTLSQAKLGITFLSLHFTSRITSYFRYKHTWWFPLHLGYQAIFQSHCGMIWWWLHDGDCWLVSGHYDHI